MSKDVSEKDLADRMEKVGALNATYDYETPSAPLTMREAVRASAYRDVHTSSDRYKRKKEEERKKRKAFYTPPTAYTQWAMEEVAERTVHLSPPVIVAAAMLFVIFAIALLATLILTAVIEMHSSKDVLAFGLTTTALVFFTILVSIVVDVFQPHLPFGARGPFTYRYWVTTASLYVVLAALALVNLVRFCMVAHDVDDYGDGEILRRNEPVVSMVAYRIIDRYAAALWGCIYMWAVAAGPLIFSLANRMYPEKNASLQQVLEEVEHCGTCFFSMDVEELTEKAKSTEGASRTAALACILDCIRRVRPTSICYWSESNFSNAAFVEMAVYLTIILHGFVALLYSTDAIDFFDQNDVYRFYFLPSVVLLPLFILYCFLKNSPSVDNIKTKFSRNHHLYTLLPIFLGVIMVFAFGFRGSGISSRIVDDDDADDDDETYFLADDDYEELKVEADRFFDYEDDDNGIGVGAVTASKVLLYNEIYSLVDGYLFFAALILYYACWSFSERLRPTIVGTLVSFDREGKEKQLADSADLLWYTRSPAVDSRRRDRFMDPSAEKSRSRNAEDVRQATFPVHAEEGAELAARPIWKGSILSQQPQTEA